MTSTFNSSVATGELRDFFDRIAAGDYHQLAKELGISHRPPRHSAKMLQALASDDAEEEEDPNMSVRSTDSVESFKFRPTAEGIHRAVSLLRGGDEPQRSPTPAEEEAFQFTFRLMIHKLYSIKDFARMVEDVVRTSQERYQPLPPDFATSTSTSTSRRRASLSFSFHHREPYVSDGDSFTSHSLRSPTSPSDTSTFLPSSPTFSWTLDRLPSPGFEHTDSSDARVVKKRIVGRKLSVAVAAADGTCAGEECGADPAWVYDAAAASFDSSVPFFDGPFSPVAASPARDWCEAEARDGDYISRKRRFSFLTARGL